MLAARIEICAHVAAGLVSFFHFLPGDFQMKLVSFDDYRIGIVHDDSVVDVSDVTGAASAQWPPVAMNHLIANFPTLKSKLGSALTRTGVPLAGVKLRTPVPGASKVIAYPINYHKHGEEMGSGYRANVQGFFLKPPSALSGASEPIALPTVAADRRIDHECELAIVIGKKGRDIPRERWPISLPGWRRVRRGSTPSSSPALT